MKPCTLLLVTAVLILVVGCRSTVPHQHIATPVGAYSAVPIDTDVQAAAEAAVRSAFPDGTAELIRIEKAERQVVAGMNYSMTIVVRYNGEERTYATVVWRKLDGTHDVTSWSEVRPFKKSDD